MKRPPKQPAGGKMGLWLHLDTIHQLCRSDTCFVLTPMRLGFSILKGLPIVKPPSPAGQIYPILDRKTHFVNCVGLTPLSVGAVETRSNHDLLLSSVVHMYIVSTSLIVLRSASAAARSAVRCMLLLGALSRSCQSLAINEVSKVARSSLVSTKNSFTCAPHIANVLSSRTDNTCIFINCVGLTPMRFTLRFRARC